MQLNLSSPARLQEILALSDESSKELSAEANKILRRVLSQLSTETLGLYIEYIHLNNKIRSTEHRFIYSMGLLDGLNDSSS